MLKNIIDIVGACFVALFGIVIYQAADPMNDLRLVGGFLAFVGVACALAWGLELADRLHRPAREPLPIPLPRNRRIRSR